MYCWGCTQGAAGASATKTIVISPLISTVCIYTDSFSMKHPFWSIIFTHKCDSYFWRDKNDNDISVSQGFISHERSNGAYHVLLLLWVLLLVSVERHPSLLCLHSGWGTGAWLRAQERMHMGSGWRYHPAQAAQPFLLKDSGKHAWRSGSSMPIPHQPVCRLEDMRPKASRLLQQEGGGLQETHSPEGALEHVVIEAENPKARGQMDV